VPHHTGSAGGGCRGPSRAPSVPVSIAPTLWPLWEDAILVSAAGLMRSARLGVVVNASSELLQQQLAGALAGRREGEEASHSALPAMRSSQPRSRSGPACLCPTHPHASTSSCRSPLPFTLTLSGASRVVLRGPPVCAPFSPRPSRMRASGGWPATSAQCRTMGAGLCWTRPRRCSSAAPPRRTAATSHWLWRWLQGRPQLPAGPRSLGASLVCPPFCAGAVGGPGGAVPLASSAAGGGFVLGLEPPAASTAAAALGDAGGDALPVCAAPRPASSCEGIYYAAACADTGLWTDPASGACANASDPLSLLCAYGGGEGCVPCPGGALCPGGSRLWPRQGFWAPSEAAASVAACAPPDPLVKCGGWSVREGAVQCGSPYRAGSYLCGACAPAHYPYGDGSCAACPVVAGAWDRYRGMVQLLGVCWLRPRGWGSCLRR